MQVTSSLGGYGHPNICRRPCILFLRGRCEKAQDCGFCHMHHETQQKFRSKFPFPGSSQTPSWESFFCSGAGPLSGLDADCKIPVSLERMHEIPGMLRMPPFCHLTLGLPRIQNFLPSTSSNEIFSGTFLFRASLRWSYHMSTSTWRLVALVDILGRFNLCWKSFSMIIADLTRRVIFLVQLMCCSFSRVKSQSAPIQPRPFRRELHARFDMCWSGWVWPVWSAQYVP